MATDTTGCSLCGGSGFDVGWNIPCIRCDGTGTETNTEVWADDAVTQSRQ